LWVCGRRREQRWKEGTKWASAVGDEKSRFVSFCWVMKRAVLSVFVGDEKSRFVSFCWVMKRAVLSVFVG
jgi:hypothetical protein